jgi:hypothetical protein
MYYLFQYEQYVFGTIVSACLSFGNKLVIFIEFITDIMSLEVLTNIVHF